MGRRAARWSAVCALAASLPWARAARATDFDTTADATAQAYDVRSPTGETILERRRLTTTLGVSIYDLLDTPADDPAAPQISFKARMRYDADYGVQNGEVDPTNPSALVPGASQGLVDLMYAYVEGRRFLHGMLGFRLGRQYMVDALGWWSFDGAEASVTTPFFVKAEAYGGLEQRGGMPLSTSRFESDGIWRGNRSNFDPSLYPQFQPADIAPAFGVALESAGITWLHGRLDYRRVYDTGTSNVSEFAGGLYTPVLYDGTRVATDRLGYAVDASLKDIGGAKAGLVYDFYNAEFTSLYASLDGYIGKRVTVGADYDYYVPSYDADSIWNFFAGEPTNNVGLRANVNVTDRIAVAASGNVRVYSVQTAALNPGGTIPPGPYSNTFDMFPGNGHPFDEGANVLGRYHTGATLVTVRGAGNWGDEGDRVGADLAAQHVFESRYMASVRTGLWQWDDKLQPTRDATSFNYVLGLGYRFVPRAQTTFEWEHDMNRLVGQRLRLMLYLTVALGK
jgi:hypothetical protein